MNANARSFAAAEARTAGYGGVSAVARATGIARSTIDRGLKDLESLDPGAPKVRRQGAADRSCRPIRLSWRAGYACLSRQRWAIRASADLDIEESGEAGPAMREMGHEIPASRIPKLLNTGAREVATIRSSARALGWMSRERLSGSLTWSRYSEECRNNV
jgi:hypothetical protein